MAFVMVLAWSRQIFLRFSLTRGWRASYAVTLRHLKLWSGLPRILLYEIISKKARCLSAPVTQFAFIRRCWSLPDTLIATNWAAAGSGARQRERLRAERAIRYVRESFFAARSFADLSSDLNAQAIAWCNGQAAERLCPAVRELRVHEAFAQEQARLTRSAGKPICEQMKSQSQPPSARTLYARFDLNDYSVPHTYAQHMVTVRATPVSAYASSTARRSWQNTHAVTIAMRRSKTQRISTSSEAVKRRAREHRGANRLTNAVPVIVS